MAPRPLRRNFNKPTASPGITGPHVHCTRHPITRNCSPFAEAVKSNWAGYLASLPDNVTSQVSVSATVVTGNRITGLDTQTVKLTNDWH